MHHQRRAIEGQRWREFSLIACCALSLGTGCKKQVNAATETKAQAIEVTAIRAAGRQVPVTLAETGSFVADEASKVAPPVAGRVFKTPVNVGTFVKTGDVLCELDHRDAELKLVQMRAQLAEATAGLRQSESRIGLGSGGFDPAKVPEVAGARANYESSEAQAQLAAADAKRYANLIATGDTSQSVYEKMRTQAETAAAQANASRQQYESALNSAKQGYQAVNSSQASLDAMRAQVSQAEKALADTTIRAPFDGFVSARPVSVGEWVATTNTVATVVRVGVLKLQLQTPERNAAGLKMGMPVTARVAAYGDRDFVGETSAINPAVNPDSRSFILEARFQNTDNSLRPGMFSTARVVLPGTEAAVFLPKSTVLRDRTTDSNQIYVLDGGKAHLRIVTLGEIDNNQVRVLSGLTANEMVATSRQSELYDGAPVDIHGKR
ncbi:efflux RND transporter periplasmic adaptor subunit [Granulicella sibirica]|uniref:Putative Co/Zn/Cd efflux system membrane fusion protein n=1 Tax=Granulicella sibirica TaxID=2479048 RepID=A0A4Q0T2A7_9BACT|nr:efflux RND transporter periplasmic adaptor subunit [Granulicella sibirica]RXH55691.1 putative Co/Zn/Cd efflux system membrane fusion protein [Granulicella sibirica]